MAEHFSFFDPVEQDGIADREYNAQQFTDYFHALVTTGLMKGLYNELKVTANGSNMMVEIDTGVAFVQGRYYRNDSKLSHTHDTESLGKNRIDRIVVRRDLNTEARYVRSFIKKGVASTNPVAPALTRNANVYEISLAQVKIIGGQTFIPANAVTDERGNDSLCPWAGSNILPNFDDSELESLINKVNTLDSEAIRKAEKGKAYGVASLGSDGKVPANQLNIVDATTSRKGIVQLNSRQNDASQSQAATPYAVKQVNDRIEGLFLRLGSEAETLFSDAVAIGVRAKAHKSWDIAIGAGSLADKEDGVAVGGGVKLSGKSATAIGCVARAQEDGTSLGFYAKADGRGSAAIGAGSAAPNSNEGVLGTETSSFGAYRWKVPGNFSVSGSKNFEIPHPHPDKKATHVIRHGAVESPTPGDTLYRYFVDIKGDIAHVRLCGNNEIMQCDVSKTDDGYKIIVPLPDYWVHLNKDPQVTVSPDMHFGMGCGCIDVEKEQMVLFFQSLNPYHIILYGTRDDDNVQEWYAKGVEREIGESWLGETYVFNVDEIITVEEIKVEEEL